MIRLQLYLDLIWNASLWTLVISFCNVFALTNLYFSTLCPHSLHSWFSKGGAFAKDSYIPNVCSSLNPHSWSCNCEILGTWWHMFRIVKVPTYVQLLGGWKQLLFLGSKAQAYELYHWFYRKQPNITLWLVIIYILLMYWWFCFFPWSSLHLNCNFILFFNFSIFWILA